MAKHKKVYGYTTALWEEQATCPTLFREVSDWKEQNGIASSDLWKASISPSRLPFFLRGFSSWFSHRDRTGDSWNLCHYWSNFEIADLDFFRGSSYQSLYAHLEKSGKFYLERVHYPWIDVFVTVLTEIRSGEMPLYTHWQSTCLSSRKRSITLQILHTATIGIISVRQTHPADSS